jgi:ribA/ribD-fused uncharacterized protein
MLQRPDAETIDTIYFYEPEGRWGFLANFSTHSIRLHDRTWRTVEHFFQAQKFAGTFREDAIEQTSSPSSAKALAKSWARYKRRDWSGVRLLIMREAIWAKFTQHNDLALLLLSTDEKNIVEKTNHDRFWGCDQDGRGSNMMGKILMEVRADLRTSWDLKTPSI